MLRARRIGVACLVVCGVFAGILPSAAQNTAASSPATYGPVTNETLWSIAKTVNLEVQAGSTAQMAWALFRANPDAFDGAPGKIRKGAILTVPDQAFVRSTPSGDAYAFVTGMKDWTPQQATAPAMMRSTTKATASAKPSAPTPPSTPLPEIVDLELQPALGGEQRQWLGLVGTGFRPGATLEFRDVAKQKTFAGRKPASVTPERIEYAGRFGRETSTWQVVVRNPDGSRSEPFEFDAGANVTLVLEPRGTGLAQAPSVIAAAQAGAGLDEAAVVNVVPFTRSSDQQELAALMQSNPAPEQVYLYLAALEGTYAGDVDFDYPYGVSALDSGRHSDAVLILQRAVASKPKFAGARMELARAYYASGDNESARREFTVLQGEQPPEEAARVIAEYLAAIDQRAAAYQKQQSTFLEVGFGYDSNANGGPDIQSFLVSGIAVALDSRNQSTNSAYYGATLGGSYTYPFAPGWRVLGQGQAGYRQNPSVPFVNSQLLRGALGLEWAPGRFSFLALPSVTQSTLDTEANSTTAAFDASGSYSFPIASVSLNGRYAQARYAPGLEIQDVDSTIGGAGVQALVPGLPVVVAAAVTGGRDEPVLAASPFGRDLVGGRLALIADLGQGHTVLLSSGTLTADYDGEFLPGQERDDDQFNAALGYQWGGWKPLGWTLRGQVAWIDNKSTVQLFDYDRFDAGISVRREFK